jgi:hypothetical protein
MIDIIYGDALPDNPFLTKMSITPQVQTSGLVLGGNKMSDDFDDAADVEANCPITVCGGSCCDNALQRDELKSFGLQCCANLFCRGELANMPLPTEDIEASVECILKSCPGSKKDGDFKKELESLINKYSKENDSNTPDFILAQYMSDSLGAFDKAVRSRESWYGRGFKSGSLSLSTTKED